MKQVKKGAHLHWPDALVGRESRYRGGAGYVVDLSAPMEAEWCAGQLHKLEDAPKGATPDKITLGQAARKLQKLAASKAAPKPLPAEIMEPINPF